MPAHLRCRCGLTDYNDVVLHSRQNLDEGFDGFVYPSRGDR